MIGDYLIVNLESTMQITILNFESIFQLKKIMTMIIVNFAIKNSITKSLTITAQLKAMFIFLPIRKGGK